MASHCLAVCHASLTVALQKAMGALPSDTESFLLHQYLSDCWGLQSFKSVVKNSLLFVPRVHHMTDRVKKMACFNDRRNLNLPKAAMCKICNTCTILHHNQSERIVRFRRTVLFQRTVRFRRTLRKPIGNVPPTVTLRKKNLLTTKTNGNFFLVPTVTESYSCLF